MSLSWFSCLNHQLNKDQNTNLNRRRGTTANRETPISPYLTSERSDLWEMLLFTTVAMRQSDRVVTVINRTKLDGKETVFKITHMLFDKFPVNIYFGSVNKLIKV